MVTSSWILDTSWWLELMDFTMVSIWGMREGIKSSISLRFGMEQLGEWTFTYRKKIGEAQVWKVIIQNFHLVNA